MRGQSGAGLLPLRHRGELVAQACLSATETRVATYRTRFAAVTTVGELLELGRAIHAEERADGNPAVLAQTLTGSPLTEPVDPVGIAYAVSAGSVGLTLFESVDPEGGEQALLALSRLAALVDVGEGLGPIATRAVRAKLRKAPTAATPGGQKRGR